MSSSVPSASCAAASAPARGLRARSRSRGACAGRASRRAACLVEGCGPVRGSGARLGRRPSPRRGPTRCAGSRARSRRKVEALLRQAAPAFLEQALHALDGVAVFVEQRADAAQEVDILRPIIAPAAAALERPDLAELAFPEPQHMLRDVQFGRDLADGAKCLRRLLNPPFDGLNCYGHVQSPTLPQRSLARFVGRPVDQGLQDVGRSEDKDASGQDWHFLSRLRISANTLALVADREAPERRDLHRFPTSQSLDDFGENRLDKVAGFVARQSHFLEHRLARDQRA